MVLNHSFFGYNTSQLERMLINTDGFCGVIRFKYYGEFEVMSKIHKDCKDDIIYVGNSLLDGAPVFIYNYDNLSESDIKDFKQLNIILRRMKIKIYSKKELTKKEQSFLTFFRFFMNAYNNKDIKSVGNREIDLFDIKN